MILSAQVSKCCVHDRFYNVGVIFVLVSQDRLVHNIKAECVVLVMHSCSLQLRAHQPPPQPVGVMLCQGRAEVKQAQILTRVTCFVVLPAVFGKPVAY